ncbi:unnamed protein product [Caenorhabditis sp. 36 PRJEB53466]|nr:unnamed protein product [Caenorhabditis sp. 36 PRJEB53466]
MIITLKSLKSAGKVSQTVHNDNIQQTRGLHLNTVRNSYRNPHRARFITLAHLRSGFPTRIHANMEIVCY